MDSDALEALIKFLYTGECAVTAASALPLCDAATRLLDVPNLAAACERFARDCLAPSTACLLLGQAARFKMQQMADDCQAVVLQQCVPRWLLRLFTNTHATTAIPNTRMG